MTSDNSILRAAVLLAPLLLFPAPLSAETRAKTDLTQAFELPPGFHIYRAAGADLSGGSYDITFDGQGRLLVGDKTSVRRLVDRDGDGVFDGYEVIATGLGPRGPQGLLLDGDRLLAVGGDGIQLFDGYTKGGPLVHRGRIGAPFSTGGDHTAHTLLRGHDGYTYFITGDGGGTEGRRHITEPTSPALTERMASVFRIDPTGTRWECVARGGRNPPNLGQNYLGELFSLDSDMEWHVAQPWYRPVRLHHWLIGGDQGWMRMDALPPYAIDNLPGIDIVGRGSPDWGVFYEHEQLPARYKDAYLVSDYPSKSASNGHYATGGRLLAFFLKRQGAEWSASHEVLARPRAGAKDERGQPIQFALVDIEVAPDGSIYLSDHNQGIWRITYDAEPKVAAAPPADPVAALLALPQPSAEWSRQQADAIRVRLGDARWGKELRGVVLDRGRPLEARLRALRLLAPTFAALPANFVAALARDPSPELRGQAAWLRGIRGRAREIPELVAALGDQDAFVRRRAAEALTRVRGRGDVSRALVERLADPVRIVRYSAMMALAHQPAAGWFAAAVARPDPQIRMRALVAALERKEPPPPDAVRALIGQLLPTVEPDGGRESRLDFLRVVALSERALADDQTLRDRIVTALVRSFPDTDPDVRREQIRTFGLFRATAAFDPLVRNLRAEPDFTAQFHIARALGRIPPPAGALEVPGLIDWMVGTQTGWFARSDDKGVEFAYHFLSALSDLGRHQREALLGRMERIDPGTPLGGVALDLLSEAPDGETKLVTLYRSSQTDAPRINVLNALRKRPGEALGQLVRKEIQHPTSRALRNALLLAATALPPDAAHIDLLRTALDDYDVSVARAAASALAKLPVKIDEALAGALMAWLARDAGQFKPFDRALAAASGARRATRENTPEAEAHSEAMAFWTRWYAGRFGKAFAAPMNEKPDDQVHAYILAADLASGDARHGQMVYDRLQCGGCHGGPGGTGTAPVIGFAPDLTGVTRRLSRPELADALVYPSKQVAERFRVMLLETTDGESLTGFVTTQNEDGVVLIDRAGLHRVPRSRIRSMALQPTSLMPDRLLSMLNRDDLQSLLSFLARSEALGTK